MEIEVTDEFKNLDSGLIQHLLIDEEAKSIFINPDYLDVFKIIKKNKTIYVDFKDIGKTTHIIQGFAYFDNKKIFTNLLTKLGKYIKEKYIDRKSVERFFERNKEDINWDFLCINPNLSEAFFERCNNADVHNINWKLICLNTNMSESFF